jgi:hypothetical protein
LTVIFSLRDELGVQTERIYKSLITRENIRFQADTPSATTRKYTKLAQVTDHDPAGSTTR